MAKAFFGVVDITVAFISLCSFVLDIGSDVAVCVQFLYSGLEVWGWMTLALTLVPAVIMNVFSLAWHIHDKTTTPTIVLCHVLLLAPVQRYITVLHLGVKSRRSKKVVHTQKAWRAQNDISILRLFEAFMESAPQLVLQLFIMLNFQRLNWFTGISAGASFLSLSWSLTAYSDSLRRACKLGYQRRVTGLLLHWCWQFFMSLSRICAFVFFAHVLQDWVFVVMGSHWLLSFVWICIQGTDFGNGFCEKWMFRGVCAFIYIFVFLNLNDGVSRYRITSFYLVILVENTAMFAVYFLLGGGHQTILAALGVFGGFFLGLLCMLAYYGFLHPTKPVLKTHFLKRVRPAARLTANSQPSSSSSIRRQRPIFSIESPNSFSVMETTSINLSHPEKLNADTTRTPKSAFTLPVRCHQTMQKDWLSGMDSSCTSSSSSLASEKVEVKKRERPSSRTSEHSNESDHSNSRPLLADASKNNLSKSPPKAVSLKRGLKSSKSLDKSSCDDDAACSDDMNVVGSESPSLSRCSWARSSDNTRQSLGLEEFVTLGFDCSSSIERRVSDSGSFNNRLKSLSPLNASNLWQDARFKLRQTIAATIAAATGNPSSNEGTPNVSQSSLSQTVSSQDESVSSLNQNFMDSKSSYRDSDRDRIVSMGSGSLLTSSGKQREGLCSLPDIFEAVENEEQMSDMSYENSSKKSPCQRLSPLPWFGREEAVKMKGSPYPEDSTLTASKLGGLAATPLSFLNAQSRLQSVPNSPCYFPSEESVASTPPQNGSRLSESSSGKKYNPDGSPFTDQELISVMAKSLQSYTGASSSTDSTSKEREGLALTLEDLQYPSDLDQEEDENGQPSIAAQVTDSLAKSRSTSSLFHDGEDSSPASSASKMQRLSELKKPDSDISPNAFKHLDFSSNDFLLQSMRHAGNSQILENEMQANLKSPINSHALKILMEAYGQLSISPQVRTPDCAKLSRQKRPHTGSHSLRRKDALCEDSQRAISNLVHHESSPRSRECKTRKTGPSVSRKDTELFDSIAWQKSKLKAKQHYSENENTNNAYVGKSSTKKLNVLCSNNGNQMLELYQTASPVTNGATSPENNEGIEYVKGKYCPPLCNNPSGELVEESMLKNFNQAESNYSHKTKSLEKDILTNSMSTSFDSPLTHNPVGRLPTPDSLPRNVSSSRRSLMKQESNNKDNNISIPSKVMARPNHRSPAVLNSSNPYVDNDFDDIHDARVVDSPLSYSRHVRSTSMRESGQSRKLFPYPVQMDSLTDQELKFSAKQVENYFSQALRNVPLPNNSNSSSSNRMKSRKAISSSDLEVHVARQPLKPLQNSPQYIPHHERPLIKSSQPFDFKHEHQKPSQSSYVYCDRNYNKGTSRRLSLDNKFSQ